MNSFFHPHTRGYGYPYDPNYLWLHSYHGGTPSCVCPRNMAYPNSSVPSMPRIRQNANDFYVVGGDGGQPIAFPSILKEISITIGDLIEGYPNPDIGTEDQPFPLPSAGTQDLEMLNVIIRQLGNALRPPVNQVGINRMILTQGLDLDRLVSLIQLANYLNIPSLLNGFAYASASSLEGVENCIGNTLPLVDIAIEMRNAILQHKLRQILQNCTYTELEYDALWLAWVLSCMYKGNPRTLDVGRAVSSLAYSPDGSHLAIVKGSGLVIYDTQTWQIANLLPGQYHTVLYNPSGGQIAVSSSNGVQILVPETLGLIAQLPQENTFAYNHDGSRLAVGSNHRVIIYNTATWEEVTTISLEDRDHAERHMEVTSVVYNRTGTQLAIASNNNLRKYSERAKIRIWDIDQEVPVITRKYSTVYSIAYSPDGTTLAAAVHVRDIAGHNSWSVELWNTQSWDLTLTISTRASVLAYSPDGTRLATGDEGLVQIWDIQTSTIITSIPMEHGRGPSLAYNPVNGSLAVGGSVVRIFTDRQLSQPIIPITLQDISDTVSQRFIERYQYEPSAYSVDFQRMYNNLSEDQKRVLQQCFGDRIQLQATI